MTLTYPVGGPATQKRRMVNALAVVVGTLPTGSTRVVARRTEKDAVVAVPKTHVPEQVPRVTVIVLRSAERVIVEPVKEAEVLLLVW